MSRNIMPYGSKDLMSLVAKVGWNNKGPDMQTADGKMLKVVRRKKDVMKSDVMKKDVVKG